MPLPPGVAAETESVMVSKTFPMAVDNDLTDATNMRAINSKSSAYSTKSCPFCSFHKRVRGLGIEQGSVDPKWPLIPGLTTSISETKSVSLRCGKEAIENSGDSVRKAWHFATSASRFKAPGDCCG